MSAQSSLVRGPGKQRRDHRCNVAWFCRQVYSTRIAAWATAVSTCIYDHWRAVLVHRYVTLVTLRRLGKVLLIASHRVVGIIGRALAAWSYNRYAWK